LNYLKLSAFLLCVFSFFSFATTTQEEIDHLLNYVEITACKYERNGTIHHGKKAVKHIKNKYDYFEDDIKTAEDFIQYSATKSTFSGDYYHILCDNQPPVRSKDWLLEELKKYRKTHP
jgi:hypothetical protein